MIRMSRQLQIIAEPYEVLEVVRRAQRAGKTVGVVPTMGALHEGHLSLVRGSIQACDETVVTIFVNPTQFGPNEDFDKYPRTLESDVEKLSTSGVQYVFAPARDKIYPAGHSTFVDPPAVALPLEGEFRPGHFRGVATIVLKLFNMIPADIAFFGQKDYQQSLVIRHMAAELNLPIEIRVQPTVREKDGLAMSSRNAYLSTDERKRALAIFQALERAKQMHAAGENSASPILAAMRKILADAGIDQIDYVAVADRETLRPREELGDQAVALIAAHVGTTRLIDNVLL